MTTLGLASITETSQSWRAYILTVRAGACSKSGQKQQRLGIGTGRKVANAVGDPVYMNNFVYFTHFLRSCHYTVYIFL